MLGLVFLVMVFAPCAIAVYSKFGSNAETGAVADEQDTGAALASQELAIAELDLPAPSKTPSLSEIAESAAKDAARAQAFAAQARLDALHEASREAARRAEAASKLAQAAERELFRATQASIQAEAQNTRAKQEVSVVSGQDYLPENHPSLDFPRSRVQKRVA